uniref:Uncharacterized protein n=1 Tax=Glossina palpalis gambiensis TaxID=67801 RepID=A0A1B0BC31_9MUSC
MSPPSIAYTIFSHIAALRERRVDHSLLRTKLQLTEELIKKNMSMINIPAEVTICAVREISFRDDLVKQIESEEQKKAVNIMMEKFKLARIPCNREDCACKSRAQTERTLA